MNFKRDDPGTVEIAHVELGEWPSVEGHVTLPGRLIEVHANPKILGLRIQTVAQDGSLKTIHQVDEQGRFLIHGLPNGIYQLSMSDAPRTPPFTFPAIRFVAIQETLKIFEIPLN
jgi:hypothetical protein